MPRFFELYLTACEINLLMFFIEENEESGLYIGKKERHIERREDIKRQLTDALKQPE